MIRLPPTPILLATAKATFLAWLVLRGAIAMESLLAEALPSPTIPPQVSIFVMLAAGGVAVLDLTVARERTLLGNLAVGRRMVFGVSLMISGALEMISAPVVRNLGLGG